MEHLRLRIYVLEPWNFEGLTGRSELVGWTADHHDAGNEEWEITLDDAFDFNNRNYGKLLVSARYVGEPLARVFDAIVGFPIRIAHRSRIDGWIYAFGGTLAIARDDDAPAEGQ